MAAERDHDSYRKVPKERRLLWPAIVEIAVHIGPAERAFNWIDLPILVAIELLKMVVSQFRGVRVRNACTKTIPTRIVTLGAFQHAVVHEISSWLHDGFRHPLLMNFHTSMALGSRRLHLSRYRPGSLLNSFRLVLHCRAYEALLGTLARRVLPLHGLLVGRLGGGDRSRFLCLFCGRDRLPARSCEYGERADCTEHNKL